VAWIVNDSYQSHTRASDIAEEGSYKTTWKCYKAVCIASGKDFIGHKVKQGPVVIVDNETPRQVLENWLNRFSSFHHHNYKELPIYLYPQGIFRFDRKVELDKLLVYLAKIQPIYVGMDSMLSMLPLGRNNLQENSSLLGGVLDKDLLEILKTIDCVADLSIHAKKDSIQQQTIEDVQRRDAQSLARGHGGIVGEGCDTAFILKKISEFPDRACLAIFPKSRRVAISIAKDKVIYVELKEETYGYGWANFVEIDPQSLPPSENAEEVYKSIVDLSLGNKDVTSNKLVYQLAFSTKKQIKAGVKELLFHKVIVEGSKAQSYIINPRKDYDCNKEYLDALL